MNEHLEPGDELLGLCLDLRAWAEVHGAESARLRTEQDHPLPATQPVELVSSPASVPPEVSPAVSAPQSTPSLERLQEQVQGCTQCKLHLKRTQAVFGCGDEQADIVFIGSGPEQDEDLEGVPFAGESGELLNRIIENVLGLQRSEVYLCNLVKCRPPGDRTPETDEVGTCSSFLWQQLDSLRPVIVVALGSFAAQTLLQSREDLGQLRGEAHAFRGAMLLATYHPADLLRDPGDKRKVFEDMKLLRNIYRERTGRELPTPPRQGR